MFYVHIIIYLKLELLPATSASCPVTTSIVTVGTKTAQVMVTMIGELNC